jgi:tRNA (cmo5U34)-methyltransferase
MKSDYRLIARAYASCERLVFGDSLQRCRTAFIQALPKRILSVGEGDGRFSEALLNARPKTQLQVIEPADAMRREALLRNPNLEFVTPESAAPCDAIVLNFVLDLFSREEAVTFLDQLPESPMLIVGDFFPNEVPGRIERNLARLLVWIMYRFFNLTTGLKTRRLPPICDLLTSRGWTLRQEEIQWHGFIRAQYWER